MFGFLISVSAIFVVYQNYVEPAQLSNITLENSAGQKVVFVKMSHIATENFYDNKAKSLENLANDNFIILAEGVRK